MPEMTVRKRTYMCLPFLGAAAIGRDTELVSLDRNKKVASSACLRYITHNSTWIQLSDRDFAIDILCRHQVNCMMHISRYFS